MREVTLTISTQVLFCFNYSTDPHPAFWKIGGREAMTYVEFVTNEGNVLGLWDLVPKNLPLARIVSLYWSIIKETQEKSRIKSKI